MTIRNQRAFAVGLFFLIAAATFFVLSLDLQHGTAARMGPGYFPWLLSLLLGAIGLVVAGRALAPRAPLERLAEWDWKRLGWIAGSVVLFAAVLPLLGMVVALMILVVVASMASREFTLRGATLAGLVLVVISVGIFHFGIDMRMPLWPIFLR